MPGDVVAWLFAYLGRFGCAPARNRHGAQTAAHATSKKRPNAEDADEQCRHVSAIGSEDEDGVLCYE